MNKSTIEKYQVPTPRYTSYPTVPYWQEQIPEAEAWLNHVSKMVDNDMPMSIYIHLPFCENLCTYCGCHKRITKNHQVEAPYIKSLLNEWNIYRQRAFDRPAQIKEIHLGGGTPTFFSPIQIKELILKLTEGQVLTPDVTMSFEAHPADTTKEHLDTLFQIGFKRISIGVQEFSPLILKTINRKQTTEQVINLVNEARDSGYESINFDLLYGLPHQKLEDIHNMMDYVAELRPERIAFYGYAHVPWIKPSQRAYSFEDLPQGMDRWNLFVEGKKRLLEMGYQQIGMDHFALPDDELAIANSTGKLHRNFMGYTHQFTNMIIGLGASSISDSWDMYVQNEKKIERYQEQVNQGQLPLIRGHELTEEDQILRLHILNIMCRYETAWTIPEMQTPALLEGVERLKEMIEDGFIQMEDNRRFRVTSKGRPFIRNIAMMLDARYWRKRELKKEQFSNAL